MSTVMVVDDSAVVRKILSTILTRAGISQVSFTDGYEALHALKTQPDLLPSMMILDLHMPKMDGYTLAHLLRSNPRFDKSQIIFLTGYDNILNRLRARLLKSTRYMTKPFRAQDILGIVSEYLHIAPEKGGYHGYPIAASQH